MNNRVHKKPFKVKNNILAKSKKIGSLSKKSKRREGKLSRGSVNNSHNHRKSHDDEKQEAYQARIISSFRKPLRNFSNTKTVSGGIRVSTNENRNNSKSLPGVKTSADAKFKRLHHDLPMMRNLVSTLLMHPNVLGHDDLHSLREFFGKIGVRFTWDTTDISIPIELSESPTIAPRIHPPLAAGEVPSLVSFGCVTDMMVDPETQTVTIRNFSLTDTMKTVLNNVLCHLYESPHMIYAPTHIFLYEFCVKFGAAPAALVAFAEAKS